MAWTWRRSPYRNGTFAVHLALAEVANEANGYELWLTRAEIQRRARCGRHAVDAALALLVADGYLEVSEAGGGRGRPTRYRFLMPKTAPKTRQKPRPKKPRPFRPETAPVPPETAPFSDNAPISQLKETQVELNDAREALTLVQPEAAPPPLDQQVFDAWIVSGRKGTTRFTDDRRRLIRKWLKVYPLEDLLDAVRGWTRSSHHNGSTGHTYNDLGLLLRDAAHVEMFRDLWRDPQPPSRRNGRNRAQEKQDMIMRHFGLTQERNP